MTEQEDEASLDKKMIAVIAGAKTAKTEDILFNLITQYVNQQTEDDSELEHTQAMLKRHGLESVLWEMLNHEMGYRAEEPSLENLLLKLFCTDLCPCRPTAARPLENVLLTPSGRASATAFMVTGVPIVAIKTLMTTALSKCRPLCTRKIITGSARRMICTNAKPPSASNKPLFMHW